MALRHLLGNPAEPNPLATEWRDGLPILKDGAVLLRELRSSDAPSLVDQLSRPRVSRFIEPSPSTTDGFRHFIRWTRAERRKGALACYGIVLGRPARAVGIIQVWRVERDFSTAEWGFALGEPFWGTGVFMRAARLVLDVVFLHLGVYRLEARAVDANGRGNRALEKLGARREGVLRGSFHDGIVVRDHVMWSILAPEWRTDRVRGGHAN